MYSALGTPSRWQTNKETSHTLPHVCVCAQNPKGKAQYLLKNVRQIYESNEDQVDNFSLQLTFEEKSYQVFM